MYIAIYHQVYIAMLYFCFPPPLFFISFFRFPVFTRNIPFQDGHKSGSSGVIEMLIERVNMPCLPLNWLKRYSNDFYLHKEFAGLS